MDRGKAIKSFHWLPLSLGLAAALIIGLLIFRSGRPEQTRESPPPPAAPKLSMVDIIAKPDWNELEKFQDTISRETFLHRLSTIYTRSDHWRKWIEISKTHAKIGNFTLRFSTIDQEAPGAIWNWNRGRSLNGLKIAIDPGHIGGKYAEIEERKLKYGESRTIEEGTITLATAKLLKTKLEGYGAEVSLVRNTLEPVTNFRADQFHNPKIFYRTAEIHARAKLINETLQPDLVLCLHYNASGSPIPVPGQHFHILLNGTYHESELAHEEELFAMLQRLLANVIEEEVPMATAIAEAFVEATGLPAYQYRPNHPYSQNIDGSPYLWARNLLANRLYQCPVIFLEPYVMNSTEFVARHDADPEAIYEEYASAVAEGLVRYYSAK